MELLERSAQLALLDERLATVRASVRGRLVLVAGDAGAGKTALVRAFVEQHPRIPVLEGACEALFTPRALGPFVDIATDAGGDLASLAASEPSAVELLAALSRSLTTPHLIVVEDLHWADEATLDVLRLLGRRAARMPALVVATYRDEELARLHRLRVVLGELPHDGVDRLRVEPLSAAAVGALAAGRGIDTGRLHERTGGNPFFVTEVLAAEGHDAPTTVRDAVLARAARLSPRARTLLEAVAVVPPRAELWLLEQLAAAELSELEACLASGMLRADGGTVGFRHEIARATIESELPPDRFVSLHRAALAALGKRGEPARLAHHAESAGEGQAVLIHASAAGDRAARIGAHREAAAHYASALRHASGLQPADKAGLLERLAFECYITLRLSEATDAYKLALGLYRAVGDQRREGDVERWLSRLAWSVGDRVAAEDHALKAVALLETHPESRELAMAYSNVAQLQMLASRCEAAIEWGERALALAERLGETEIVVHALNNVGSADQRSGRPGGREKLERSLALALDAGLEDHVARAYVNLSWMLRLTQDFADAHAYIEAGLDYVTEHDLEIYRLYLTGMEARSELDRGRWDVAEELAESVLHNPAAHVLARILPLTVIGLLRARRGGADPWGSLDEALDLARSTEELQRLGPVVAARAETRWLEGSSHLIEDETAEALDLAVTHQDAWITAELHLWRSRAGLGHPRTVVVGEPFAADLAGDPQVAAAFWTERGNRYAAALALGTSDDDAEMRAGLAQMQDLGARAAASLVARRLRERGARDVRRGPRAHTRANPAGLTGRQLEVLELIAQGERNAEIAAKLFLSTKTVDHHVSAILTKLGVATRQHAAAEAIRLGIASA